MKSCMPTVLRLTPLALAVSLLSACSSAPPEPPAKPLADKARFSGATLADLESREIVVDSQSLKKPTAEEALNNYQTALSLFQDPTARLDTLKRMAELTMHSSQSQDSADQPDAKAKAADQKMDADIDSMLYERFMQGMASARDRQSAATYMDMANNVKGDKMTSEEAKVSYGNAVKLYQELIKNSGDQAERSEAMYQLAKAYDMNGQRAESVAILKQLTNDYPGSQYYVESEFRIGEDAFSNRHYVDAADAYANVVKAQDAGDFHDQALYKQGWALYKASDYEAALPVFFQVTEELREKVGKSEDPAATGNMTKLLDDTYHIISLSFIQLDGAKSAAAYFAKVGEKDYESDVYMNLGQTYQEKRLYRNAADTFDAFVAKHPTDPKAPEFSSATIRAFQEGGFPTEVIPAKENFIKRYGPDSEFWAKADEGTRKNIQPLLLGHIIDLAKYYHSLAQQSGKEDDYMKASTWYRQHLALNPPESEAVAINELLAEALFSAKHFDEAIAEFEKTAYNYNNPKAVDAAYFALVAYQEQAKSFKGTPEQEKAWFDKRVASSQKYAEKFPGDQHTAPILEGLTNDQIDRKDMAGAMKTAGIIVQLQPPAPEKVQMEAWIVIGDGETDLGRPDAAEFAYKKVLAYKDLDAKVRAKYQSRLAASVYKQAEKMRDSNDIDGAVATFLRVAEAGGDPKLAAGAEFDAATLLLNAKRYADSIPVLEGFRQKYPQSELIGTIPDKLALAYEQTQQFDKAAKEYEGISASNLKANPDVSREAEWTAAELYGKAKQPAEAIRVYQTYVANYPKPVDVYAEAQYKLYTYYSEQKVDQQSQHWLEELAKTYDKSGAENTARTSYLGAMAHFKLNQPLYDQFATLPLNQPLKKSLGAKKQAMQKVLDAYSKTSAIGVAEFTTASNYQIAETYRKMAADLMASERPKGLDQDALEQYSELLEEQATPLEDKSIDLYVANANLAKQNIYDDSVRKSFEALAKLSPGRYNKHEQSEMFVDVIY